MLKQSKWKASCWGNYSASEQQRAESKVCDSITQKSVDPDSDVCM